MPDEADLLMALLRAESPSGAEGPAVREFVRIATELGYRASIDAVGNGIARRGSGRPQILYLGHIDTVPGALPVRREGDRVHGRGACDAKGPLLAALLAGAAGSPEEPGEIVVAACVGEETDSRGARGLLPHWDPDAVIAGEPSGWDGIAIGYKGDLRLRARFAGSREHLSSATPTTAERAFAWVAAVRAEWGEPPAAERFRRLTGKLVSFRTEEFGDAERAEVVVDLRLPPGVSAEELERRIRVREGPESIETIARIDAFESARTDPVVRALVAGVRSVGGTPTLYRKGATSDLNLVAPAWGHGGAAYGPGDPHLDHTDREALDLADLRRATRVLGAAFAELRRSAPVTPRRSGDGPG